MAAAPTIDEDLILNTPDGAQIGAFLTLPRHPAPTATSRAVLLLPDIFGFQNPDNRAVATRLAAAGLPTLVPDLFRAQPWTPGRDRAGYEAWRLLHHPDTVRADLLCAHRALLDRGLADYRLGLLGFCFGGGRLMDELARAENGLNPAAAVAFYPTRFDAEDTGRNARCPLLVQTGDQDELVPMSVVDALRTTLRDNPHVSDWAVDVFPGFGHAFAHHPASEEDKVQSEIALEKAVTWLQQHL